MIQYKNKNVVNIKKYKVIKKETKNIHSKITLENIYFDMYNIYSTILNSIYFM